TLNLGRWSRTDERFHSARSRNPRDPCILLAWARLHSRFADWSSRSAKRRRRHRHLSDAEIGNGRAWPAHLRRERLLLLPQRAGPRRLRRLRYRSATRRRSKPALKMG